MSSPMAGLQACLFSVHFPGIVAQSSTLFQYQTALLGASLVLLNVMACRVFRLLRQPVEDDSMATQIAELSPIRFRGMSQRVELASLDPE